MQGPEEEGMKRTRKLTRAQSKYGCLTCKTRKVRCDETQPTCRRCTNSGFVCEGYTNTRPASTSQDVPRPSVSRSISSPGPDLETFDLSQVSVQNKLTSILQSSNIAYIGRDALDNVIRTTSQLAPSSLTAIPALELLVQKDAAITSDEAELRLRVDTAYGQAIRLFVDEIRQDSASSDAVFITGIILIAIELLQRRRQDAWKHLLGSRQWLRSTASPTSRSSDIEFLYRIYDLQSLLYSHNVRSPVIEPHENTILRDEVPDALSFADVEKACVEILHNAHALISSVHHAQLFGTTSDTHEQEQKRRADLCLAVRIIDQKLNSYTDIRKHDAYLILRNLCQMTILELDQLGCVEELTWDRHEKEFHSIIEAAEEVSLHDREELGTTRSSTQLHLTLQLGIIPPLLLTALKYRHPLWRRRAISCLRTAGIEGPFIGKQLAAIASRCVEIEESSLRSSLLSNTSEGTTSLARINVRMPPEEKRLAHCRTDEDNGNLDQISWPPCARGSTLTLFLARKSPTPVLGAKILTSNHFRVGEEYRSLQHQTVDSTIWRVWTETVTFNGTTE